MQPAVIENHTAAPGAPANWDPERHGRCSALPIRAEVVDGIQWMRSAWEPTPRELAALNAGAKVELGVAGSQHPVVNLGVGPVPADAAGDVARVSFTVAQEVRPDGSVWCMVEGRFDANRFPADMELTNPGKPRVVPLSFEEAAGRLISAVTCHAREQGWVA